MAPITFRTFANGLQNKKPAIMAPPSQRAVGCVILHTSQGCIAYITYYTFAPSAAHWAPRTPARIKCSSSHIFAPAVCIASNRASRTSQRKERVRIEQNIYRAYYVLHICFVLCLGYVHIRVCPHNISYVYGYRHHHHRPSSAVILPTYVHTNTRDKPQVVYVAHAVAVTRTTEFHSEITGSDIARRMRSSLRTRSRERCTHARAAAAAAADEGIC